MIIFLLANSRYFLYNNEEDDACLLVCAYVDLCDS